MLLASGTSDHAKHLKELYSIRKGGPIEKKKGGPILEKLRATNCNAWEQGVINSVFTSFIPSQALEAGPCCLYVARTINLYPKRDAEPMQRCPRINIGKLRDCGCGGNSTLQRVRFEWEN